MSDRSRSRSRSASPVRRSRSPSPRRSRSRSRSPSPRRNDRPIRDREAEAAEGNKLFIGNIGFDTTERELEDLCDRYGRVVEARLARDRYTDRSSGFAFVTMERASDADKCVDELNGRDFNGRAITVQISHGKGGRRRLEGGSRMDEARATGACFDYINGRCSRGDDCKFKHIDVSRDRGGRDRDYRDRSRSRDRGYGRDRDYHRRSRSRSRSRSPRRSRDYGRDRDRDSSRRDRGGSRDYGRDRDDRRRSRSRSRSRDRRR